MGKKNRDHDPTCACVSDPQAECDCQAGRGRRAVQKAKSNLKRAKVEIIEGLIPGDDWLGRLRGN